MREIRARRETLARIITERSTSPSPSLFLFPFLGFPFTGFDSALPLEAVAAGQSRGFASVGRALSALPAEPRLSIIPRTAPVTYLIRELTQEPLSRRNGALRRGALHRRGEIRSERSGHSRVTLRARTRTHARTHADRAVTRATYVYFRRRKRDTRCTIASCEPVTPIQESPADCELAPCRDMGVVEAWEMESRGE